MALAVAPATTSSSFIQFNSSSNNPSSSTLNLFGNNFQFEHYSSSSRKPISQDIIQQYSSLSSEVLEIYEQFNYIHKKMRKKERTQYAKHSATGFRSHGDFSYQQVRSAMVDWQSVACEVFGVGALTQHSAIAFVDAFLDQVPIDPSRLLLVAAAAILIAAKMEEQEPMVPRVAMLHAYCYSSTSPPTSSSSSSSSSSSPSPPPSLTFPASFPASFLVKVESLMLNRLDWQMVVVTPLHFLQYYLQAALLPHEPFGPHGHRPPGDEPCRYLAKMAEFLVDMCNHHSLYREYLPSVVAGAAIGTARQMLCVRPAWSPALSLLSNLHLDDVSPCMLNIAEHYRQSFSPLA